ncbi:MAG: tripartite tricarboxylate transporter TctB family protein [Deltaproteobacteria bacterium]|jgi:putative tricarboxylic transport membrane protein
MTPNRLSGVVVVVFGLILLVWIIPWHTEAADYGWLRPATLPNVTAIIIVISGIIHVLFPAGSAEFDLQSALRAGLFFVISLAGLFIMRHLGFLIAAPLLIMILMLMVGERRPLWLVAGAVMVPLGIWSSIELLLKRPLP